MGRSGAQLAVICTALLPMFAAFARAQSSPPPAAEPSSGAREEAEQVTAEELLRALRRERPVEEPIPSASLLQRKHKPPPPPIHPEGTTLIEASGTLDREGAWWRFHRHACEGHCPPLKVLPNAQLELMTRMLPGEEPSPSFIVSGELTAFEHENYLLVKHTARASSPARTAPPSAPGPSPTPAGDGSAEDVLRRLQELEPDQAAVVGAASRDESVRASRSGREATWTDGAALANRPGRLIREGEWWTLVLESDGSGSDESPIRILPSRQLELMIEASNRGSIGLVFMVSGEATLFDGANYLLARSAMRRLDLGNLRK